MKRLVFVQPKILWIFESRWNMCGYLLHIKRPHTTEICLFWFLVFYCMSYRVRVRAWKNGYAHAIALYLDWSRLFSSVFRFFVLSYQNPKSLVVPNNRRLPQLWFILNQSWFIEKGLLFERDVSLSKERSELLLWNNRLDLEMADMEWTNALLSNLLIRSSTSSVALLSV